MTTRIVRPVRVVAVVLHFDAPDDTLSCVAALRRSTMLDLAIVVVANGPQDDRYRDLVDLLGLQVTTIATGSNLGYAAGNNVGIRWALERRPEFVWVLNPDTEVAPTTLSRLLSTAVSHGDAGIIGPRLVLGDGRIASDGGIVDAARHGATSNRNAGRLAADITAAGPRDVDYVSGAALLLRLSMLEAVGQLPEDYFLYFEETDYCRAVQAAGWRTLVDDRVSIVHHKRSSGVLPTPYYLYYMTRNRMLFASRHFDADPALVLADFDRAFLTPWRSSVEQHAPSWLPQFDEIVALALEDARSGVTGRQPRVDVVPVAVTDEQRG